MDGQDLYTEFKSALDYLGPGFRGMDQVQVHLEGTKLCLTVEGRGCNIDIPVVGQVVKEEVKNGL